MEKILKYYNYLPSFNKFKICFHFVKGQTDRVHVSRKGTLPPVYCPGSQGRLLIRRAESDWPLCCGRWRSACMQDDCVGKGQKTGAMSRVWDTRTRSDCPLCPGSDSEQELCALVNIVNK